MELSKNIESILNIFEQCKSDSQMYETKLKEAESEESDILHQVEGVDEYCKAPPKYNERAVLATRLQEVLLNRREAKDLIKLNKPILEFINSETGQKAINMLKMRLGDVRKIEDSMETRRYYRRAAK